MKLSKVDLVWANKPGCDLAVAEFWIGREQLWFTIFLDEEDHQLKIELLPPPGETKCNLVELSEVQHMIESAKHDLLAMDAARGRAKGVAS